MSVLTDLQLHYEHLADDPIDRGIFYGRSVLQALASPLRAAPVTVEVAAPIAEAVTMPAFRTARPVERSRVERTRYVNYAARPSYYTQRAMIGAL